MADNLKQIKDFPLKSDFGDNDLLLIQGQGTTYSVKGTSVKAYAEDAAKPQVALAAQQAAAAEASAQRAEAATVHPAIPDPASGNWKVWDQVSESYQETVPPVRAEGQDFEIRGYYPTLEALEAAVPSPEKGYAYGIGTEAPYDIYVWDMVHGVWVNNGPMTASGDMLRSTYDPRHMSQDIFAYADRVGLPAGGAAGQIPVKKTAADHDVEWKDMPEGVGRSMAGKEVSPEKGTTITAAEGAEIFNDYRPRIFGTDSDPESTTAGAGNIASGTYAHAEGSRTTATGDSSHAEGNGTIAKSTAAHAEGKITTALSYAAHAEGYNTVASSMYAHAEGQFTTASGMNAHAEGNHTTAKGGSSHAEGYNTIAAASYQHVGGMFNIESSKISDRFILGKGESNTARSNCFRVTSTGVYATGNYNASGADYAEMFEWADGNPDSLDRTGRFVTLEGKNICLAGPGDDYILGIVSGAPSVIGDVYDDQWQGMYLTDIFGRPIWEDVEIPEETIEEQDPENPGQTILRMISPAHTERRQKLNPAYDNTQPYIPRTERPEWAAVGLLGKLVAVDDGTCQANGWAKVGPGGSATGSVERTRYRVMERLDETHVRLMIL